jgi:hypothetical protein
VPLDQASGQVLAQTPRWCDHEHGPAKRGWIRDARAREPAEFIEQVCLRGNRTAQHKDPTDDRRLFDPAHRTRRSACDQTRSSDRRSPGLNPIFAQEGDRWGHFRGRFARRAAPKLLRSGNLICKYMKYKCNFGFSRFGGSPVKYRQIKNDIELHFQNGMIDVLGERAETPRSLRRRE